MHIHIQYVCTFTHVYVFLFATKVDNHVEVVEGLACLRPHRLPGGCGYLTVAQREQIKRAHGVSANVRRRNGWTERMVTVSGAPEGLIPGMTLALNTIRANNTHRGFSNEFVEIPGPRRPPTPPPPPPVQVADPCSWWDYFMMQDVNGCSSWAPQHPWNLHQWHAQQQPSVTCGTCSMTFFTEYCGNCGAHKGDSVEARAYLKQEALKQDKLAAAESALWMEAQLEKVKKERDKFEEEKKMAEQMKEEAEQKRQSALKDKQEAEAKQKAAEEQIAELTRLNKKQRHNAEMLRKSAREKSGEEIEHKQHKLPRLQPKVKITTMGAFNHNVYKDRDIEALVCKSFDDNFGRSMGKLDVCINCAVFDDPAEKDRKGQWGHKKGWKKKVVDHIGEHTTTICNMVYSNQFWPFIKNAKKKIGIAMANRNHNIHVGLFCKSGNHRSVGEGRIFTFIFQILGWAIANGLLVSDAYTYNISMNI